MKEIIGTIGRSALYVLVIGAVLALVFSGLSARGKTGLLQIMGDAAPVAGGEPGTKSAQMQKALQARTRPQIRAADTEPGRAYAVEDVLTAVDADGGEASLDVLSVLYKGADVTEAVTDGGVLTFPEEGAYRIHVRAIDSEGACTVCSVYVSCGGS